MLARVTQAEQLAAQAAQWQAAGRADMAAPLYRASLDQDPSKFAVRMQLAECLAYLGQPDQATENYLMVAQAYAARGRHQECLAICERIIAIAPHAFVYMSVGPMVRRIGRHARTVCAKAAEAHLAAGRQTDGLQILRLGAELDPHNAEVRLQLARIFLGRHMNREAVEALSDAGNLLIQAKRYPEYVEIAQQILAIEPRDLQTLRDLPRVFLELKKPHDAVRTLGQLTKASPGDIVGYEILAQAFASIGRTDKSLSVLERLVEQLGSTGRAAQADAILNHARYWRPTDLGFIRSLKRMEVPRPAPAEVSAAAPREGSGEGTVVLSIADLLESEGSTRPPSASAGDGVELTEAEGTLTLRIGDLILDEMEQAAGLGVSPPTRPPAPRPAPPRPAPPRPAPRTPPPPPRPTAKQAPSGESTISLDGADLLEALIEVSAPSDPLPTGSSPTTPEPGAGFAPEDAVTVPPPSRPRPAAAPGPGAGTRSGDDAPTVSPPGRDAPGDDAPTIAPPGGAPRGNERVATNSLGPAVTQSMSSLIYDDETDDDGDDDGEPATLLHMKPLTAEDIARAQQGLPIRSAPTAPAPTAPAASSIRSAAPEPEPEPESEPAPAPDMGDDAPTLHRMQPLTAADIAQALAKQAAAAEVSEEAATVPPAAPPVHEPEAAPSATPPPRVPPPLPSPSGPPPSAAEPPPYVPPPTVAEPPPYAPRSSAPTPPPYAPAPAPAASEPHASAASEPPPYVPRPSAPTPPPYVPFPSADEAPEESPPPLLPSPEPPPSSSDAPQPPPMMMGPDDQAPPPMLTLSEPSSPAQAPSSPAQAPPPLLTSPEPGPPLVSPSGEAPPPLLSPDGAVENDDDDRDDSDSDDNDDGNDERTVMNLSALTLADLARNRGSGSSDAEG